MEDEVKVAYQKYADALQEFGDQNNAEVKRLYDEYQAAADAAEKQRQADYNKLYGTVQENINSGMSAYDSIIKSGEDRLKKEEEEDARLRDVAQKKVSWSSAAELGANLINMFSVGAGATNQQYKSYSEDWRREADQKARERRARMDNIRERQKALNMQRIQLQMTGNDKLAQMQAGENAARYQNAMDRAGKGLQAGVTMHENAMKTKENVAKAGLEGSVKSAEMKERRLLRQATGASRKQTDGTFGVSFKDGKQLGFTSAAHFNNTVASNLRHITNTAERAEVARILQDKNLSDNERIDAIVPYIDKYPEIEKALVRVSKSTTTETTAPRDWSIYEGGSI